MFDIGVSELAVIGVVAMIVIGPEELPRVARTAGHLLGRLRRYVADVKSDISREMELSELKHLREQVQESTKNFEHAVKEHVESAESEIRHAGHVDPVATALDATAAPSVTLPLGSAQPPGDESANPVERDENQMDLFGAPADTEPPHTGRS